jgi:putative membrane protein
MALGPIGRATRRVLCSGMSDATEDSKVPVPPALSSRGIPDDISVELSSRRTGMSFQRTRMSADRTLMSVIRTSLSLISFGFTIYQFFEKLQSDDVIERARAPRNFGLALVYLGVTMVAVGIAFHIQFMLGLRQERAALKRDGLIHGDSKFPGSYTLGVAILLLLLGISAIASIGFNVGPFR